MMISSQIPDGQPNRCHVCSSELKAEPADPAGDVPCSRCGHLLWFTWEDLDDIAVIKPIENLLTGDALDAFLDSVALRPGIHLVLDLVDVNYFASAALARLVGLKKRVISVGGQFTIRHVHPELMKIFQIARLDHLFDLEP